MSLRCTTPWAPSSPTFSAAASTWGYWINGHDQDSIINANRRMTHIVATKTKAGPRQRVLDVGCENGIPALQLAAMTGASVTGITISEHQLKVAQTNAGSDLHVKQRRFSARMPGRSTFRNSPLTRPSPLNHCFTCRLRWWPSPIRQGPAPWMAPGHRGPSPARFDKR